MEDLAKLRRSSEVNPLLVFEAGSRVVLNGSESTDADTAEVSVAVVPAGAAADTAIPVVSIVSSATTTAATLPLTGDAISRTVTLNGTGSGMVRNALGTGQVLTFQWRQIGGPRGAFSSEFSALTQFTAPEFPGATGSRTYSFELTVDASPPADRSEPIFLQITQSPQDAAPLPGLPVFSGLGGGCRMAPGGASSSADLLALAMLGLAWLALRRRTPASRW